MAQLLEIVELGGSSEIGASSKLIRTLDDLGQEYNILVDSGTRVIDFQLADDNWARRSEGHTMPSCAIHSILITHAHLDHIGNLPFVAQANPKAQIIMTTPTFWLGGGLLRQTFFLVDDGRIEMDWDRKAKFAEGARIIKDEAPKNLITKPEWRNIAPGIDVYFHPNGHIRGSAMIIIRIGNTIIVISGDMSVYNSATVKGMEIPEWLIGQIDFLFVESVYGNRILVPRAEEEDRMAELALKTMKHGGNCLFPAFGIGRTPDVGLALILRGVDPVFIDGTGRDFLTICADPSKGYWCESDYSSGIDLANDPRILRIRDRDERLGLIYSSTPFCVVTTAGMMIPGSCASQYAFIGRKCFLERPGNLLGFTGFMAENSGGRMIEDAIQAGKHLVVDGRKIVVRAKIPNPKLSLSAHADGMQVAGMVIALRPRKVFINHGTDEGREGLRQNLSVLGYQGEVYKPNNSDTIGF